MQAYLVPLGVRCNAAMVTSAIVDQPRFVFDWAQMNLYSMIKVLNLEPNQIRTFWIEYFSKLNEAKRHVETNSWFPHDTFSTDDEMSETVEKYIRRTQRLHAVIKSDTPIFFLIFHGYPDMKTQETTWELLNAVVARRSDKISFIVCNASYVNDGDNNVYLIYEPLLPPHDKEEKNWEDLTNRVKERVRLLLQKKNISIIPFSQEVS
jgi:hypothetical protein